LAEATLPGIPHTEEGLTYISTRSQGKPVTMALRFLVLLPAMVAHGSPPDSCVGSSAEECRLEAATIQEEASLVGDEGYLQMLQKRGDLIAGEGAEVSQTEGDAIGGESLSSSEDQSTDQVDGKEDWHSSSTYAHHSSGPYRNNGVYVHHHSGPVRHGTTVAHHSGWNLAQTDEAEASGAQAEVETSSDEDADDKWHSSTYAHHSSGPVRNNGVYVHHHSGPVRHGTTVGVHNSGPYRSSTTVAHHGGWNLAQTDEAETSASEVDAEASEREADQVDEDKWYGRRYGRSSSTYYHHSRGPYRHRTVYVHHHNGPYRHGTTVGVHHRGPYSHGSTYYHHGGWNR